MLQREGFSHLSSTMVSLMASPDFQTTCYFSSILDLDMQILQVWQTKQFHGINEFFFYQLEANEFLQSILINGSSKIDAFYAFFIPVFGKFI